MTTLITGGCGFIGANLVRRLREDGRSVRILDDLSQGRKEDIEGLGADLVVGDLRDQDAVTGAVAGADADVHLAAHTRVVESVEQPRENFDVNALGTLNVLLAAREERVERVVFASTGGAIIGDAEPPVHEEMVPRPLAPYGASKLACEAYCSAFAGAYGMDTIALRFANVYGPYSYNKGSVVATYLRNLLLGRELLLFGDGTQTRDFVHVRDICAAITSALAADFHGFEAFHLGSGVETSMLELIRLMAGATGRELSPIGQPARAGEVYRNCADISKARRMLAFEPEHALSDGLKETWSWFRQHRDLLGDA